MHCRILANAAAETVSFFLLPGVRGFRFTKFFSVTECAVSGRSQTLGASLAVFYAPTFEIKILDKKFRGHRTTHWLLSPYLIFHSRIAFVTGISSEVSHFLQHTTRINGDWFFCIGIKEGDEKERNIIFPRNSPESREVDYRNDITITICSVRNQELSRVDGVVKIPTAVIAPSQGREQMSTEMCSQNDAAESKPIWLRCA